MQLSSSNNQSSNFTNVQYICAVIALMRQKLSTVPSPFACGPKTSRSQNRLTRHATGRYGRFLLAGQLHGQTHNITASFLPLERPEQVVLTLSLLTNPPNGPFCRQCPSILTHRKGSVRQSCSGSSSSSRSLSKLLSDWLAISRPCGQQNVLTSRSCCIVIMGVVGLPLVHDTDFGRGIMRH